MIKEYATWHDDFGRPCRSPVLAKFTRSSEAHGMTKSWVAVWSDSRWEPIWLDIRDCKIHPVEEV